MSLAPECDRLIVDYQREISQRIYLDRIGPAVKHRSRKIWQQTALTDEVLNVFELDADLQRQSAESHHVFRPEERKEDVPLCASQRKS